MECIYVSKSISSKHRNVILWEKKEENDDDTENVEEDDRELTDVEDNSDDDSENWFEIKGWVKTTCNCNLQAFLLDVVWFSFLFDIDNLITALNQW